MDIEKEQLTESGTIRGHDSVVDDVVNTLFNYADLQRQLVQRLKSQLPEVPKMVLEANGSDARETDINRVANQVREQFLLDVVNKLNKLNHMRNTGIVHTFDK